MQVRHGLPSLVAGFVLAGSVSARGDVYSYEDKSGVVHFTNVRPGGSNAHQWKTLYKSGPGRASVISGAAPPTTFAGCFAAPR